ncbi:hypothetical protein V8C86DRAFT_2432164 [Haematococcus lacustris]
MQQLLLRIAIPTCHGVGSGMLAGGVQCLGRGAFIAGHRCPVSTKAAQLQRPQFPSIQALLHPAEQSPPAPSLPRHEYQQPLHNVPTAVEFNTIQHVSFEGNQQEAASNGLQQQDHLEEAQRVQQEEAAQGRDQEHRRQQQELEGAAPGEQEQQPQAAVATRVVIVAVDPDTHGAVTMATWVTNDPLNAAVDLSQLEPPAGHTASCSPDVRVFDMPCATVELIGKKKPTGKPSKRSALGGRMARHAGDSWLPSMHGGWVVAVAVWQYLTGGCHKATRLGARLSRVPASRWKRDLGLVGCDKSASRALAAQLFPAKADILRRVKDHGRAESLLIAAWALGCRRVPPPGVSSNQIRPRRKLNSSPLPSAMPPPPLSTHLLPATAIGTSPACGAAGGGNDDSARVASRAPTDLGVPDRSSWLVVQGPVRRSPATDGYGNALPAPPADLQLTVAANCLHGPSPKPLCMLSRDPVFLDIERLPEVHAPVARPAKASRKARRARTPLHLNASTGPDLVMPLAEDAEAAAEALADARAGRRGTKLTACDGDTTFFSVAPGRNSSVDDARPPAPTPSGGHTSVADTVEVSNPRLRSRKRMQALAASACAGMFPQVPESGVMLGGNVTSGDNN